MKINSIIIYIITIILFLGCSAKNKHLKSKHLKITDVYVKQYIFKNDNLQQKLIQRFKEYWHYRQKGDYNKSYMFELPYQRYLMPFPKYKALAAGSYVGKKTVLEKINLDKKNSQAILQRKVYFNNLYRIKKDKWLYINGQWYHKFYQSILPPKTEEEAEFQ